MVRAIDAYHYIEYSKKLGRDFKDLLSSPFVTFDEVKKLKKIKGVYLIYFSGKIIYAGSTNNFNVRFGTDMLHKTTHTLHSKLLNEGMPTQKIKDFFKNKCKCKIKICKDMLRAEALEHFVIWATRPKYNKNIYDYKNSKIKY